MRRLTNLGSESIQRHVVLFDESEIVVTLRFFPTIERWTVSCDYNGMSIYNKPLSVGVLHIRNFNLPFDFFCRDLSGNGLDPFQKTDFSDGRCALYLVEREDMRLIRGVEVPA